MAKGHPEGASGGEHQPLTGLAEGKPEAGGRRAEGGGRRADFVLQTEGGGR